MVAPAPPAPFLTLPLRILSLRRLVRRARRGKTPMSLAAPMSHHLRRDVGLAMNDHPTLATYAAQTRNLIRLR